MEYDEILDLLIDGSNKLTEKTISVLELAPASPDEFSLISAHSQAVISVFAVLHLLDLEDAVQQQLFFEITRYSQKINEKLRPHNPVYFKEVFDQQLDEYLSKSPGEQATYFSANIMVLIPRAENDQNFELLGKECGQIFKYIIESARKS